MQGAGPLNKELFVFMSQEFDCCYGEEDFKAVESRFDAIEALLIGNNTHAKKRLLFIC